MNRESCDLMRFFASAKHSISILATNLDSFKGCIDILNKKAAANVKVRIAAMHPELARNFFKLRMLGSQGPEEAWEKMKSTLVLVIVDNRCYVAYLLNSKKTRDTIHFLYGSANYSDAESPVNYFKSHFETTWDHEKTTICSKAEIAATKYDAQPSVQKARTSSTECVTS